MQQRTLGTSGLHVSAIGLGGMPMSVPSGRPSEGDSIAVILHALALGVTLIDTADSYCLDATEAGHNERLIGKALSQLPQAAREKIVVATKGGLVRPGGRWERCGKPSHLRTVCEQSLQNLRVSAIDLYQYHAPDPAVSLAESLGELKKLQDEGKIRHIGVSNFSVTQIEAAQKIVNIVSVQNQYSPACRTPETDGTLAATHKLGMAFLPWSPLGGIRSAKNLAAEHRPFARVAELHGTSAQQVALAWLLNKHPGVIPIPGASRKQSIEDSVKAAELKLTADEVRQLDAAR